MWANMRRLRLPQGLLPVTAIITIIVAVAEFAIAATGVVEQRAAIVAERKFTLPLGIADTVAASVS